MRKTRRKGVFQVDRMMEIKTRKMKKMKMKKIV